MLPSLDPTFARNDVAHVLLSTEQIQAAVAAMGIAISRDYAGRDLLIVSVLKGSAVLIADLLRAITIPVRVDFISITSYRPATRSSGAVRLVKDLEQSIEGRDILLIEDIIDTGLTLNYILKMLRGRFPSSLEVGTLFDKPARRLVNIPLRYAGFELPDLFVVGYGLDFRERYRNLPFLCVLKPDVVED